MLSDKIWFVNVRLLVRRINVVDRPHIRDGIATGSGKQKLSGKIRTLY
jgi:hypothetical protein